MRVALAVPCYVDQLRPDTARATLTLLERLGCEVSLAFDAPCCGQPMTNVGVNDDARDVAARWARSAAPFEYVVMPSGSCVHHVRHHLDDSHSARVTYDLCEFIAGPLGRRRLTGDFPHRVAMHLGCHAQRGLRLGGSTELHEPLGGPMHSLLSGLDGITIVPLNRRDECCGFGGSFSIGEPDVSAAMGRDRLRDYADNDAEVLVSSDVSCLVHMEALLAGGAPRGPQRPAPAATATLGTPRTAAAARPAGPGELRLRTLHIAELLEEATR